jgi:hypothetical protein
VQGPVKEVQGLTNLTGGLVFTMGCVMGNMLRYEGGR